MSRTLTPPQTQPALQPGKVPHDKIAMRAYEKWIKRGRPMGTPEQDWIEAEAELRAESSRSGVSPGLGASTARR
jgi:hypothetical protein